MRTRRTRTCLRHPGLPQVGQGALHGAHEIGTLRGWVLGVPMACVLLWASKATTSTPVLSHHVKGRGPGDRRMDDWPFANPPDVAAITTRQVVHGGEPILLVSHDADDGSWQFLTGD